MGRQLHYILANLARIHGPLMSLRSGKQITIIASSPDAAREVLKTHDRDLSGRYITNALPLGIGKEFRMLIVEIVELGMIPDLSDFYPILTGMDFQGIQKKRDEIVKNFITIWDDIIKERRKQESSIFGQRDFLDALIKEGFTNDQISQLILDLLLAGTDSSSMVTEWAMAELMRNQDVLHKLRDELKREIGTEMVKESHLAHLPYLEACVKETLRLYPPGPLLIPHRALQTCQVMGYTIPKDSKILVNMWAIGRDPSIFNDSLRFNPERFLDSSLDFKGTNFAYTPFGAGRRVCPGQPLATKQVPLILASLVHSFDWFLPGSIKSTELDMNDHFAITLKKKQPLQLIPKGRK
uniref:Cytochrome P450 n=1 Tax=Quercus lobata TaxID=97700 RepID=A0A7N2MI74_QUELO